MHRKFLRVFTSTEINHPRRESFKIFEWFLPRIENRYLCTAPKHSYDIACVPMRGSNYIIGTFAAITVAVAVAVAVAAAMHVHTPQILKLQGLECSTIQADSSMKHLSTNFLVKEVKKVLILSTVKR